MLAVIVPDLLQASTPFATAPVYINSVRNYNDEQGLPEASVNSLLQAHDGYLWIATYGGLIRFDGQRFKTYHASTLNSNTPQNTMPGPPSERIVDLLEDNQHRLWIGTQDAGLSLYINDHFIPITFVCANSCEVMSMAKDQNGHDVWVLTRQGLYLIDTRDLSYQRLDTGIHGPFARLIVTANNDVYLGGINALAYVQRNANCLHYIPLPDGNTGLKEMSATSQDLAIVTNQYQLYQLRFSDHHFKLIRKLVPINTHLFQDNLLHSYISDPIQGTRIFYDSGRELPLDTRHIIHAQAITIDNQGNTWIGSSARGLWRMQRSVIGLMSSTASKMNGPARAVSDDGEGGLWFGMSCGGLRHWNQNGYMSLLTRHHPLRDDCISSLSLDQEGTLWIGYSFGLIDRLKGNQLQPVASWPQEGPLNIWQSQSGDYWVNSALHTYRLKIDELGRILVRERIPQLDGMGISTMSDSHRGGIWFVGNRGAYRIQNGTTLEKWVAQPNGVRQFRALFEDDDGSLWIGSYGGGLIHIKNGKVRTFNESNGLFDNTVSCILPDDMGRLWLAGNKGLTVLRNRRNINPSQEPEITVLDSSEGLTPPEINGGTISACHRDHLGRLWFSLISGIAMIDPRRLGNTPNLYTPVTHIESIKVNGHDIRSKNRKLTLDTKAANLEIHYNASSLSHPELIRYRYRISKSPKNWIETTSNQTILMPTLPWGKFFFEVQAKSLGGPWSKASRIEFSHPMPWYRYQSIWVFISAFSLIGLLFVTGNNSDNNRHAKILNEIRRPEINRKNRTQ